jgi:hypothetical protein
MEVPDMETYPPVRLADLMLTPGALTSGFMVTPSQPDGPRLEKEATLKSGSPVLIAPTEKQL